MTSLNESFFITFKFGGFWREIKSQNRKKYEGGNQKTVKVQKDVISFVVLKEELGVICHWLRGHAYEMHYHVCGTSPKGYKPIINDFDVMEMITCSDGRGRAEVVVIIDNGKEPATSSQHKQVVDCCSLLEMCQSYDDSDVDVAIDGIDDGFLCIDTVEDKALTLGARFQDSNALKQVLRTEAITNNFTLKIKASDRTRVIAICAHQGCSWRVRASICTDGQSFEIRKMEAAHLCPGVNRSGNKQATSAWVATEIQDIVKKNPDIAPKLINNSLETTYGLSLPYMKLWRSREQARNILFGSADDNYKWVPTLRSELLHRNPGSHVTYTYDIHDNSFCRFYVSFKVCIDGFLAGCRPLIGLDACHLKAKYLGVLLSATSLDGNNGLYTIAFAVVESESKKTWQWFLLNLVESIGCQMDYLAFISDMEKGLAEAMKNVFPYAEHRVCIRHLWKNLRKFFNCGDTNKVRSLVWTASNSFIRHEFDAKLEDILRISPQLHSYLLALPYKWSKCDFSTHIKNHYNTNNMAESFNSWIKEARTKPAVDLVDLIRAMLMELRAQRKINSEGWQGELVPHAEEYIREITTRKDQFIIRQMTSVKAEVEGNFGRQVVDIEKKECTCRFWQVTGLPCIHAVAFIGTKQHPLWHTYVDEHYHVIRYRKAYEGSISALPGKEQWVVANDGVEIGVPNTLRPRGRPKKRRFKSFLESQGSQKTRSSHKCSRCGLWGHHRTSCKNPLTTELMPNIDQSVIRAKLPVRRDSIATE